MLEEGLDDNVLESETISDMITPSVSSLPLPVCLEELLESVLDLDFDLLLD